MASEFPTRPAIAAQQLAQLRRLLAAILPANRFYRQKFSGLDTRLSSLEDFRRFPFTTKEELSADQRAFPPYGSNLTSPVCLLHPFPPNQRHHQHPVALAGQPGKLAIHGGKLEKNIPPRRRPARRPRLFRLLLRSLPRILARLRRRPATGLPLPSRRRPGQPGRLKAILDNSATVLCCTPSYAVRLAEVAAAET